MIGADFAAIEAELWDEWELAEQRRHDRIRVYGYFLAVARRTETAHATLERAITLLQNAQSAVEIAQKRLLQEHADAEIMMRVIARADPDEHERIARALEELEP